MNFFICNTNQLFYFKDKKGIHKDNLKILRSTIKNVKDKDIDEIFRMLIKEIILISKELLKLRITLDI
jgi:hypothetical protein